MDSCLRAFPEATFFLATDCADTRARYAARFGPSIRTLSAEARDGYSPEATRSALVDMLLLSEADFLCCAAYSSFSRTALLRMGAGRGCVVRAGIRNDQDQINKIVEMLRSSLREVVGTHEDRSGHL